MRDAIPENSQMIDNTAG